MKIIIFSDSHKNFGAMTKAIEREGSVDYIIHAGDVHCDAEDLEIMYPRIPVASVLGNNDYFVHGVPNDRFFELGGIKIFITHGHNYGVKYSLAALLQKGRELGADIAVFGHTHRAYSEKIGEVTLFNPGAAYKSYGVLEVENGEFKLGIREN